MPSMPQIPGGSFVTSTTIAGLSGPDTSKDQSGRDRFAADELAIVLSHFDISTIEAIEEFPRGSRRSPKLVVKTGSGMYLLKRRAKGKNDPYKVAFCHNLQLYLACQQFPLPHLIGTKHDNNSMLQYHGQVYELFEFIQGSNYDQSPETTADAGKTLALFHKLLAEYHPKYEPSRGSYHDAKSVMLAMDMIPRTLAKVDPSNETDQALYIQKLLKSLRASYKLAVDQVNQLGLANWPVQIVHSDWHPGNMLFRGKRVVGVIDYDASRIHQRVIDVANGTLQFSIVAGGGDPGRWPDACDQARFHQFLRSYDSMPNSVLAKAELQSIPWLMIEALIAESVIPIAATGSFARMEGVSFMAMVKRKVRWIEENATPLAQVLDH